LALAVLVTLAVTPAPAGARAARNSLDVTPDVWRTNIRFTASFEIATYDATLCPPDQPPLVDTPNGQRFCAPFYTQMAALEAQVMYRGKRLYDEEFKGTGGLWKGRIPFSSLVAELGRCAAGRYLWTITLTDPYPDRANNVTRRGYFTLACNPLRGVP
jgi:hypothetical protein